MLFRSRGGIEIVIIPEENEKDLAEIPKNVTESLEIKPVRWIDEVLDIALERPLTPVQSKVEDEKKSTIEPAHAEDGEPAQPRPH